MILSMSIKAQNLVTNPGFETGDTTGWFAFGSPTISAETSQVHSGTYAAQVSNRTQTYMGIAQSFLGDLQVGQTYDVSAWVMLTSGGSQTMHLTMQMTVGSTTTYTQIASGSVSASGWTQLTGQYTYSPSSTPSTLNFYAEVTSSSNASYYIDDVNLGGGTIVTNPPISGSSTVDWNNVHQRIDGFGASSAWAGGTWNTSLADLLFSTNNNISYSGGTYNGAGLSLLRNHIVYGNNTSANTTLTTAETDIMQKAQARGARVWSTPWTPAAGFKGINDIYDTNTATGSGINGGNYLGSGNNITNVNYASQLANYVLSMKNQGVNLYALSIQNEPDVNVTSYEACQWTGAQFHDFVTNLYAALVADGVGSTKIILPESENWSDPHNLAGPTLSDPTTAAEVGIIADHDYVGDNSVGDQTTPASKATSGQAVWETEVALLSGSDSSIDNGVYWARRIYQYMTQAQANAYHYWWLTSSGNQGLIDTSAFPTKRLFTFGQYSRFVRPNYYRINATSSLPSALISAYKDSVSPAFAIVAVNTNAATPVTETFNLSNFSAATVTPWITSATLSLAPQTPVTITNATFTYTLPFMSVVTFVGQASFNTAPTIAAVANRTDNVGVTLVITNTASDSDVPAQNLTFSPAKTLPANATLIGTNGVFTWRPLVSQANTTNLISVQVTDSGTPNLSATNSFTVVVNAVTNPVVNSVAVSGGQVNVAVTGPQGPDYTLLTTTNITAGWQPLFTTNSPGMPFIFMDTNSTDAARFYRLQIGP